MFQNKWLHLDIVNKTWWDGQIDKQCRSLWLIASFDTLKDHNDNNTKVKGCKMYFNQIKKKINVIPAHLIHILIEKLTFPLWLASLPQPK